MKYYFAPMEGITTYTFRNAFAKYYGGIDTYFTPFIANKNLSSRERNDILPEHNLGLKLVPQILTNKADEFLNIAEAVASYDYKSVNLNLGCPSGTVVARRRGAGFLGVPDELERFLNEIFDKCPLKISIKTRIGMENPEEWDRLLTLYAKYPIEELIIHPRLQKQGYGGKTHPESFLAASECLKFPLCYNGDLVRKSGDTYGSIEWAQNTFEGIDRLMIGRGLLQNPGFANLLKEPFKLKTAEDETVENKAAGREASEDKIVMDALTTFRAFHNELMEGYLSIMSGDANTLFKMKDLWAFFAQGFESPEKPLKKIKKATRIAEYEAAVNALLKGCNPLIIH